MASQPDSPALGADSTDWRPLDPRQKAVLRIHGVIGGAILFLFCFAGDAIASASWPPWPSGVATGIGALALVALALILPGRRYRRWRYRVGEDAIGIASGLLVRRETVVPFARVQHLDISRGPIERAAGVASLLLYTAGSYNSMVALPGLDPDEAARLREAIREHARQDLP